MRSESQVCVIFKLTDVNEYPVFKPTGVSVELTKVVVEAVPVPVQVLEIPPSGIAIAGDAEEVKVNDEGDTIFPDKVVD